MSTPLEQFVAASPSPQRAILRALLFLAARPRGRALLGRLPLALQAAESVISMSRYDDPVCARALGYDSEAVAARGRALRRAERRP